MQSTTTNPNSHRQLLMFCQVANISGETSQRFVDMATFSLWKYFMQHKHGFLIAEEFPCIWLPQTQTRQLEQVFEHTGFHQSVSKLTLETFDDALGINQSQSRFVPTSDLGIVRGRLEHHWLKHKGALLTTSEAGLAVSTTPASYGTKPNSVAASHAA
ncbi:MAG: hypothetical protein ACFHXK_04555 [bacterium]